MFLFIIKSSFLKFCDHSQLTEEMQKQWREFLTHPASSGQHLPWSCAGHGQSCALYDLGFTLRSHILIPHLLSDEEWVGPLSREGGACLMVSTLKGRSPHTYQAGSLILTGHKHVCSQHSGCSGSPAAGGMGNAKDGGQPHLSVRSSHPPVVWEPTHPPESLLGNLQVRELTPGFTGPLSHHSVTQIVLLLLLLFLSHSWGLCP